MPQVEHDLSHIEELKDEEPKKRKRRSPLETILIAALGSIVIHLAFVGLTALMPKPPALESQDNPMRARLVTQTIWRNITQASKSKHVVE
jgi:hypothetical protein